MDTTLDPRARTARTELETLLPQGIALDFDSVFPKLTGWGMAKKNRTRAQLITNLAPVLSKALKPGETVLYAASGIVSYLWESFFMGAWAQLINRTALVVTSERVLLVHTDGKKPGSFINQIARGRIKQVSAGALSMSLKLGKGSLALTGLPGVHKKAIKSLLGANAGAQGGVELLCSSCFVAHQEHTEACSHCGAQFKSPRVAALRSLFLPGLGDFYLGHRALALLEMLGSLFTWAIVIMLATSGDDASERRIGIILALLILLFANGSDALLTRAQGRKGLMSLDGKLPGPAPRAAGGAQPPWG